MGAAALIKTRIARDRYRNVLNGIAHVNGAAFAKRFDARLRFGRRLNLDNPKTLADKVSWVELNVENDLAVKCTDKYAVREYIEQKGLGSILIPLCGGPWASVSEIDVDALPDAFVVKATHGCEMNYICKDKAQLDRKDFMACAQKWLAEDYARACVEPHYKKIPHRLYAEEYIGTVDGGIVDYKFHCLNGEPCFVLTCSNREDSVKLNLYDLEWNPIPGVKGPKKNPCELTRPAQLEAMTDIARMLAEDFEFVRVDLYEVEGKVLFGELTFSPASGVFPNFTDEFITHWGGCCMYALWSKLVRTPRANLCLRQHRAGVLA